MNAEQSLEQPSASQLAIHELKERILAKYPTATFRLSSNPDEPDALDLLTYVDLEDPDEVLDLVIDRVIEMQLDDGIPVHVIPIPR